ncbi:MAG: YaaA family protein [Epsilonproteobacteria bacterium]|nr:YaaA family protein [Campylobacterota bacterium]
MLYILFSPSEGKVQGGNEEKMKLFGSTNSRSEILQQYNQIINSNDQEMIKTLFGIKKYEDCLPYIDDIFTAKTMKAIQRYDGVAYDYLQYNTLPKKAQTYIDIHTLIFSNLFGPILANDMIPIYKVKQGNSIGDIKPEQYYKERFSYQLDLFLGDNEILDLRAGYYDKFYKPKKFTTLKFLKNGKVVSHWAKAYRGIVLKEIALHQISSLDDMIKLEIENLLIKEIKETKNKKELIYEIID